VRRQRCGKRLWCVIWRSADRYNPAVPTADVGTGAAKMRCNLNSSVLRDDAVGFRVVDEYGREVLTSSLI
jgi:hypothetical protein